MKTRHIAAIVLRQVYLLRGSPTRVLPLFAWIAIDVMLWGFITRYLNAIASPGFDFVPAMLGAARGPADMGEDFGAGLTSREIFWMREHEWARSADDVLWRRSKLGLHLDATAQARVRAAFG